MSVRRGPNERTREAVFNRVATKPDEVIGEWEGAEYANAWQRLLTSHASFRAVGPAEHRSLVAQLHEIEKLLTPPSMFSSAVNAYRAELEAQPIPAQTPVTAADEPASSPARDDPFVDMVIGMQVRLMEDAFYILKLNQYGNAPDNRGWMNLFRRWGNSRTFNARFDEIAATVTGLFVSFYSKYLRDCSKTIEEWPIPHPWNPESRRQHPDRGDWVSGVFLDSGILEMGAARRSPRTGEDPPPSPDTGAHAVPPGEGGPRGYEKPSDGGQTATDPPTT
jgi:hypothetical protein